MGDIAILERLQILHCLCEYLWKKEAIFENAYVCQSGTHADGFVLCKRGREI